MLTTLLWFFIWEISFVCAMSCAKMLDPQINGFILVFMRCLFGFCFFIPLFIKNGFTSLATKHYPLHIYRIIFCCITIFSTYYSFRFLPMSTATAIGFSGPIFSTILAMIILKESITFKKCLVVVSGYLGVLIVTHSFSSHFNIQIIIALIGSVSCSCMVICIKKLTATESALTITFYNSFGCLIISAIPATLFWSTPSFHNILIMMLLGFFGAFSQFCYTKAIQNRSVSFVEPLTFTKLVATSLVGYIFFSETLNTYSICGGIVIFISTLYLTLLERQRKHLQSVSHPAAALTH